MLKDKDGVVVFVGLVVFELLINVLKLELVVIFLNIKVVIVNLVFG